MHCVPRGRLWLFSVDERVCQVSFGFHVVLCQNRRKKALRLSWVVRYQLISTNTATYRDLSDNPEESLQGFAL